MLVEMALWLFGIWPLIEFLVRALLLPVGMLACFCLGVATLPASARPSASDLATVSADPKPGDRLPLAASFRDETGRSDTLAQAIDGRPAVVAFVDYACKNICSATLALTVAALENSSLEPGADFRLIAIGLASTLNARAALDLKNAIIDPSSSLAANSRFLTGDAESIARTTASVGYHYFWDPESKRFAHAAALLIVSGAGAITRVIPSINVNSAVLREALAEARRQGDAALESAAVRLLCYGLSPSERRHTRAIWAALRVGSASIVAALLAGVWLLIRRGRIRHG